MMFFKLSRSLDVVEVWGGSVGTTLMSRWDRYWVKHPLGLKEEENEEEKEEEEVEKGANCKLLCCTKKRCIHVSTQNNKIADTRNEVSRADRNVADVLNRTRFAILWCKLKNTGSIPLVFIVIL